MVESGRHGVRWRVALGCALVSSLGACASGMDGQTEVDNERDGAASTINPRRSLIETNQTILAPVRMGAMLDLIATNGDLLPTAALTNNLLFNLYNDSNDSVFPNLSADFPHRPCDDPLYRAVTNNFPIKCSRAEGNQATGSLTSSPALDGWEATAVINRIDLAAADGAHCGEQRIIMSRTSSPTRNFVIFEAQIPNPSPSNDPCACAPLAEFWADLSDENDVGVRARELGNAFFFGHPTLAQAGFKPFMSAENFSVGTGQIRTNNFVDFPWSLREFKIIDWNGLMVPVPVPVASNLHAPLLDDAATDPRAPGCKDAFIGSIPALLDDNPNLMALQVPPHCWDAESPNDFDQGNYETHINQTTSPTFFARVQAELQNQSATISPAQLARRATFAGSCIGCHFETDFADLGNGVTAPPSAGFVHVSEFGSEDCGDNTQCFPISNALKDSFLPHRARVMADLINACQGDGPSAAGGGEESSPALATFDASDLELPDGSIDIAAVAQLDAEAKSGSDTIAGVPAGRAH